MLILFYTFYSKITLVHMRHVIFIDWTKILWILWLNYCQITSNAIIKQQKKIEKKVEIKIKMW